MTIKAVSIIYFLILKFYRMAQLNLTPQVTQPPSSLGVSTITMQVGQTVNITKSMLMNSVLPYIQPQATMSNPMGFPIGSITMTGNSIPFNKGLTTANVANTTVCYFTNNGARISKTTETSAFTNGLVTNANLGNNLLKVVGVMVGTFDLKYRAKAINGTEESTNFSTVQGTIRINVITNTNQPPTNIDDSSADYPIYGSLVLGMDLFSVGYSDPNNDPIWKVKITGLPATGTLTLDGLPVTLNQEILAEIITLGGLVYNGPATDTLNSTKTITFQVCDTGTGTYINT